MKDQPGIPTPAADPVDKEKNMSKMVIDRREGPYVILIPEDNPDEEIVIPARFLQGVEEGDVIDLSFQKDEQASREARERVSGMVERLRNR